MELVGALATVVVWLLVARARMRHARDAYARTRAQEDMVVGVLVLVLLVAVLLQ